MGQPQLYVLRFGMRAAGRGAAAAAATAPSPHEKKLFNAFHIIPFRVRQMEMPHNTNTHTHTHIGRKRTTYKSKDRRNPLIFKYTKHIWGWMDGWINGWMDGWNARPDVHYVCVCPR